MKATKIVIITVLISLCFSTFAFSKVTKSIEACYTGIPGLECRKIVTDTNYRNDGSGEWLKPNHALQFRSTNGKSANIRVNKSRSSFRNSKVIYKSAYVNKRGDWSKPGLVVEARGEEAWSYDLNYNIEWR